MYWTEEFPKEEGMFWFYGYRFGKISCGQKCEPELTLVKVYKTGDGNFCYLCDGHFMYPSVVEEPHFQKAVLPELPRLKNEDTNE